MKVVKVKSGKYCGRARAYARGKGNIGLLTEGKLASIQGRLMKSSPIVQKLEVWKSRLGDKFFVVGMTVL